MLKFIVALPKHLQKKAIATAQKLKKKFDQDNIMPFSKVFNSIKTHVNSKRDFNEFLKEQGMATSRRYPKSGVHQNMFNNLIAIGILLPGELNYQADFVNYKDNSSGKVINETFRREEPQRELPTAQASSQKMMLTLQRLVNGI